jgi:hypothetical protein
MARPGKTTASVTNSKVAKARKVKTPKAIASTQSFSSIVTSICYRICTIWALTPAPACPTRVLFAAGKRVGEGFDHPPLDTLVLAMPVSWKGTLQQYAGRLHREHASKTDVRITDFVDVGHPALLRMWDKRQRGYQAMGYRVRSEDSTGNLDA